jgi:mono/diheme cytochrome c family protein
MKFRNIKLVLITSVICALFLIGVSCRSNENSNQKKSSNETEKQETQTYKSTGTIKDIDLEKATITIDHEDIPGYMSAMKMTETVSDKKMLEELKVGEQIDFEIERTGSRVIITKIVKNGRTSVSMGGEIYKTNCAECHGDAGQGVKDKGLSFLEGHSLDHPEEDFIKQVEQGEKDEMPAFKDKLSKEEIAAVVKYVRNEIQSKVKSKEKNVGHQH